MDTLCGLEGKKVGVLAHLIAISARDIFDLRMMTDMMTTLQKPAMVRKWHKRVFGEV